MTVRSELRTLRPQPLGQRAAGPSADAPRTATHRLTGTGLGASTWAVLLSTAGVVLQVIGYAQARTGGNGVPLFYAGLLVLILPCAWVLLGSAAGRQARFLMSLWVGFALAVSLWLANPTVLGRFDELLHQGTLWQLVERRELFSLNTLLPISPYFPGLELVTGAVHWLTGLPALPSTLIVVVGSRLLLMAALFGVAERLTGSPRAAGIAALLYAGSPQMYMFNAQFAYQTLALALALSAVYFTLRAVDERSRVAFGLAVLTLGLLAVTHHLTSWLVLGLLVATAGWLAVTGYRGAARVVGALAAANLLVVAAWAGIVGRRLYDYLAPLFEQAAAQLIGIATGSAAPRTLFQDGGANITPLWQRGVMLAASLVWSVLLVMALVSAVQRMSSDRPLLRGRRASWLVLGIAAGYPALLLSRFSPAASEVADRASTFVFLGLALLVAAWFVRARPVPTVVGTIIAGLLLTGGVLLGSGPDWSRLPGAWLPSADQRSVDASSLAAAEWARGHLLDGDGIAADRVDAALLLAIGRQQPVTPMARAGTDLGTLYRADTVDDVRGVLATGDVRLVLVDRRLADATPYISAYFEPNDGAAAAPPTAAQLAKFANQPDVATIYDNGNVVIYDVSAVRGLPPVRVSAAEPVAGPELDSVSPVSLAAVVIGLGAALLLRRRRPGDAVDQLVTGTVLGVAALLAVGFVMVLTGAPVWVLTAAEVGGVLALGWLAVRRRPGLPPLSALVRSRVLVAVAVAALLGVAGGVSIVSAQAMLSPDQVADGPR
jgi:hypothetical protein